MRLRAQFERRNTLRGCDPRVRGSRSTGEYREQSDAAHHRGSNDSMKIIKVSAIPMSAPVPPERRHRTDLGTKVKSDATLIRVETDNGLIGIGAALGTPPIVAAIVKHELAPECIGEDPMFSERIYEKMYNGSRSRPRRLGAGRRGRRGGTRGLRRQGLHRRQDARGRPRRFLDRQLRSSREGGPPRARSRCRTDGRRARLAGGRDRHQACQGTGTLRHRLVRGAGIAGRPRRPGGGAAFDDHPHRVG
jgi:hypothetical protein